MLEQGLTVCEQQNDGCCHKASCAFGPTNEHIATSRFVRKCNFVFPHCHNASVLALVAACAGVTLQYVHSPVRMHTILCVCIAECAL